MKVIKKNSDQERRIIIGMIVDSLVLGRIASKWQYRMFKSKWANIVAKWCLNYYKRYEKAPMKNVEGMFETWSANAKDKSTVNLVSQFMSSLSAEYEELGEESNSDYIIDIAGHYFNQIRIERLVESVESDVTGGEIESAHSRLIEYNKIEMGVGAGIDVFQDSEAMRRAFADKRESLIKFPGALGRFFKGSLEREGFVAFMGKKGVGKSFWLQTMAYEGMLQRRKVVMFEVGDMGESQTMRRLMIRTARHPHSPCTIKYPLSLVRSKNKRKLIRDWKEIEFEDKLDWRKAKKACQRVMQKKVKSGDSYFKLSCHFNSTLSVDGIDSILQDWEREGWGPDIIVIDYADILDMDCGGAEGRDRINETWKRLRALSQRYHCLVLTATQSDTASYNRQLMKMDNFSDDRRKIDSVTGMIGINQTSDEKKKQLMRLNWVSLRDDEFFPVQCVTVYGCLQVANPAVKSCF